MNDPFGKFADADLNAERVEVLSAELDEANKRLAAAERENAELRAEKTAELDADAIIDAALRDVSAATARANRAEAERDAARERLGECIGCNYNDGPDECCPQHGRTVTEWIDIASTVIGRQHAIESERDAAVAENARLLARIAAVEALHFMRGRNILGRPVCAECSPLQPMPCPTLRALAASPTPERCGEYGIELWEMRCEYVPGGRHTHYPIWSASPTPTGPEPATDECEHGQTEWHEVVVTPLYEHRICPGPASPEPTEETPKHADPKE